MKKVVALCSQWRMFVVECVVLPLFQIDEKLLPPDTSVGNKGAWATGALSRDHSWSMARHKTNSTSVSALVRRPCDQPKAVSSPCPACGQRPGRPLVDCESGAPGRAKPEKRQQRTYGHGSKSRTPSEHPNPH